MTRPSERSHQSSASRHRTRAWLAVALTAAMVACSPDEAAGPPAAVEAPEHALSLPSQERPGVERDGDRVTLPAEATDPEDEQSREFEAELQRELEALEGADPRLQEDSAQEAGPEEVGLDALLSLAADDSDPELQQAAIGLLEDQDSAAAVLALFHAAQDGERGALIEAIDALKLTGDVRVVPELKPFLQHPDPEIREATEEAIAYLE